jgi:signal transduction histidine kinase/ActR/RegA family two-component response regulator
MDGNRPVLIGPMRHVAVPVPAHAFPAAAPAPAVGGDPQRAAVDPDLDYRGVSVIAASRPIPNTPWTVIAKIDRAEAFGDLAGAAWSSLAWWGAVMVALIAVVYGLLRHRETIHVRQQLESTEQIGFLNRLLRTISEVNELMVREKNRKRLLEETCRSIVEHAGFTMAWVGEIEPPFRVKPVAWAGAVEGYLDGIDVRYDDSPEGCGPTGTSIRERGVSAVEDVASAPAMVPWREKALARGYRSVAAVPLIQADRVLGALTVYSSEPGILRGEVLSLIQKLASDLAFALDVIERGERHLETERALSASEEQLRQAQKMEAIGRLAGGVAHDFNNLLMAISGYAELALSARTEETRRERIEEIATAAERAAALTRQLLAFSRKQVLQPRVFNLNAIVADIEKMLRRLIGENIELVTRLAPALHNVRADQGQMEQVLVNLAVNARDAMLHGGRMVIETANVDLHQGDAAPAGTPGPGPYVMLTVEDTGEGMAPDTLDRLFEPFFTTKASGKGTGLGLSTVYGIVAQSGGTITVESAVGAGSTFRVYLPAATMDEEAMEKAAQPSVPRAGGESLLVVEDNPAVRNFVIEALRGAGYEVTDADSAERALQLLAARNAAFDLLLTDVILPKMDGHDLARQAKAQRPTLRVLYMSGYVDNPRLREAALHEGIDLIEKPFTSAAIAARVRAVLDRTEASGQ